MTFLTNKGMPDISAEKMRADFNKIFNMHKKVDCYILRYADANSGDFFDTSGDNETEELKTEISIQGSSDSIERMAQGISMPKGNIHCYIKYNVGLSSTDLIKIGTRYFKINNLGNNYKNDDLIFQDFDLEFSSHGT